MPKINGKPGPKFSITQREIHLAKVSELDLMGMTLVEIAKETGVTFQQVSYDLKKIREERIRARALTADQKIEEKLAQYAQVRAAAWKAYLKSMEDKEKITEEFAPMLVDEDGKVCASSKVNKGTPNKRAEVPKDLDELEEELRKVKMIKVMEGRIPEVGFLLVICKCLDAERELEGLDKPKNLNPQKVVLDIESILRDKPANDEVDKKIDNILNLIEAPPIPVISGDQGEMDIAQYMEGSETVEDISDNGDGDSSYVGDE